MPYAETIDRDLNRFRWRIFTARVLLAGVVIALARQWHVLAWFLVPIFVVPVLFFAALRGYLDWVLGPLFRWVDAGHRRS